MGQKREILDRLHRLERRLDRNGGHGHGCGEHHDHHHGEHHHHDDHGHGGRDFDEKRVIDTIVNLVSEQVGKMLEHQQQAASNNRDNRDEGGGEKRIVDLIVACVSEHVQEIVATELDRRLGPSEAKGSGEEQPGAKQGRSRGGSSEPT